MQTCWAAPDQVCTLWNIIIQTCLRRPGSYGSSKHTRHNVTRVGQSCECVRTACPYRAVTVTLSREMRATHRAAPAVPIIFHWFTRSACALRVRLLLGARVEIMSRGDWVLLLESYFRDESPFPLLVVRVYQTSASGTGTRSHSVESDPPPFTELLYIFERTRRNTALCYTSYNSPYYAISDYFYRTYRYLNE